MDEPKHYEDKSFVADVLRGETQARRTFVERMRMVGRILSARNRRAGRPLSEEEIADLSQQVTLLVWGKLASFEGRSSFDTWVYRFCYLEFMNALRKRTKQPHSLGDDIPEDRVEFEEPDESLEETSELELLLRHLTPREAEVARLVHAGDLSFPETAQRLSISVSSVKTLYYRGLEKLRVVLESMERAKASGEEGS